MDIIAEIDSLNRFNMKEEERNNFTRITFEDIDYIVFPLIMFKNFHIQFNAEQNIIKFYTPNSLLLQIKGENNGEKNGGSSFIIVIIVIISILALLLIGFMAYRFIKKRKGLNIEGDVNNLNEIIDTKNN